MFKILTYCILLYPCVSFASAVVLAIYHAKKQGKKIGKKKAEKKESHIKRLFWEFPYRFVTDLYNRKDYEFRDNGFHLIAGEQGCGKTITLVYLLLKYKEKYPELKIRTNMNYVYEDGAIKNWRGLIFNNNGELGQIDVLDEIQNWFNSLQSKDFPVEMLQEITQQRKQRKIIFGTAQVWQRVAKPLREQVKYVYKPVTLFGCLTFCFVYKPVLNEDGQADSMKFRKLFYFVHNDKIRNAFDTYKKIEYMSNKGFKEQPPLTNNTPPRSA